MTTFIDTVDRQAAFVVVAGDLESRHDALPSVQAMLERAAEQGVLSGNHRDYDASGAAACELSRA